MARKMTKDYAQSDMEALWRRGEWHSYQDAIHWLETKGNDDNELTPGEVMAMEEDLKKLEQENKPFVNNPAEVFNMAHKGRSGSYEGKKARKE